MRTRCVSVSVHVCARAAAGLRPSPGRMRVLDGPHPSASFLVRLLRSAYGNNALRLNTQPCHRIYIFRDSRQHQRTCGRHLPLFESFEFTSCLCCVSLSDPIHDGEQGDVCQVRRMSTCILNTMSGIRRQTNKREVILAQSTTMQEITLCCTHLK